MSRDGWEKYEQDPDQKGFSKSAKLYTWWDLDDIVQYQIYQRQTKAEEELAQLRGSVNDLLAANVRAIRADLEKQIREEYSKAAEKSEDKV